MDRCRDALFPICRRNRPLILISMFFFVATPFAQGQGTEIRDFHVHVDDKLVGANQLIITERKNGTTMVSNKATVRVQLFLTFTFSYQGSEIWKDYQLVRLDGQCDNNGQKCIIQAILDNMAKSVKVVKDKKEKYIAPEVWTSSFWKLPDPKFFNERVTILDADKGTVNIRNLKYVATERKSLLGKEQTCYHFRVDDVANPIDLWFDIHHRLVRQEFVRLRHKTVIELVGLKR